MRIAILTTDNRENDRRYDLEAPYFGTAPTGLFSGFAEILNEESKIQNPKSKISSPGPVTEIHVISCTQRPMRSPEKLGENIFFHSLHVPKWGWLKTGYAGCILATRKKLRELRPDVVHAQGTERECAISASFCPYPRVLTIHGNLRLIRKVLKPWPWSALALQSRLEGFAIPRFDGILCITNYTKAAVAHEARRTWVVPNAVDPDFLDLGQERQRFIQNQKSNIQNPMILVVANVDARKNQIAFIRALDPLASSIPFEVKFFGRCWNDDYGREFQSLVAERPWCEYGGMIGRAELRKEFAGASLLALPTHEDNCPMVVLEAQAAGIPVMASNVGGVPDLVEDGVTGLLTDPLRPDTMQEAISRLLTDPGLAARLAENGSRQANKRFHPRVVAKRHLEVYRELLENRR